MSVDVASDVPLDMAHNGFVTRENPIEPKN